MFHTHPEAELRLPLAFSPIGERSWHWVELAIQIPYFLLSFKVETEDGTIGRHFIFNRESDAMSLIANSKDVIRDVKMGLLSPGYMNGSNSYQLGQIKEIWGIPDSPEKMYVMSDGEKFYFPTDEDGIKDHEMKLLINL